MRSLVRGLVVCLSAGALFAQLTPDQRLLDFQNLSALFAKRYGPYDWKKQALGFDLFNVKPWLDRVRAARDDLEFYEIEAEYVASLADSHSALSTPSSLIADLGIGVDLYDGLALIESVNRTLLPASRFPFTTGDELVSVNGRSVEDWIQLIAKWTGSGNPAAARRIAAALIPHQPQEVIPRAVELGDTAEVVIRRANGDLQTYTLPWTKSGAPVRVVGPVPLPKFAARPREAGAAPGNPMVPERLETLSLPANNPLLAPIGWAADEDGSPRRLLLGFGARTPVFRSGLPASFVQRLGRSASDYHFSGTYQANGLTIGLLRVPGFAPPSRAGAVRELDAEIDYLQKNTDGLVVDVTRNPGGTVGYVADVAARLIPFPFFIPGFQIRATQEWLISFQAQLEAARANGAPPWAIETYQSFVDQVSQAMKANRGMTDPIALARQNGTDWAPVLDGNPPATVVYTKPMIVLADEFTASAGDLFAAVIQDNARAPLVGMRTNGAGGTVEALDTGFYSESSAGVTESLMVRNHTVVTPDLPPAPYVESIGVRPDIQLDYMTRDNLMGSGRPFVDRFTAILVDQIQQSASAK